MVGIDGAPVSCDFVFGMICLLFPEEFDFIGADAVIGCADSSGPCDGDGGVAVFCVHEAGFVVGVLATAVDLYEAGEVFPAFGIAVDAGEHGFFAFENADAESDDAQDDIVFFPLVENFGFEGFGTWVEAVPKLVKGLRGLVVFERGECVILSEYWLGERR